MGCPDKPDADAEYWPGELEERREELRSAAFVRGVLRALDPAAALRYDDLLRRQLFELLSSDRSWPAIEHELKESFLRSKQLGARAEGRG